MADRTNRRHTTRTSSAGSSSSHRRGMAPIAPVYDNAPWAQQHQTRAYGTQGDLPSIIPNMLSYSPPPLAQQLTGSSTSSSSSTNSESYSASIVDISSLPSHRETERWLRRTTGIPDHLPLNLDSYEVAKKGPLGSSGHDLRVRLAIWGSPQKRLKLEEIDEVIKAQFGKEYKETWKPSIRHMLTLKAHYVNEPIDAAEQTAMSMIPGPRTNLKNKGGKNGGYWRLDLRGDNQLTRTRKRRTPGSRQEDETSDSSHDVDEDRMQTDFDLPGNPYFPSVIQNTFDLQPFIPNMYQSDAVQGVVDMNNLFYSMQSNNRPNDFLDASYIFSPVNDSVSHHYSPSSSASSTLSRSPSAPLPQPMLINYQPHNMGYMSDMSVSDMSFLSASPNESVYPSASISGNYGYPSGRRRRTD